MKKDNEIIYEILIGKMYNMDTSQVSYREIIPITADQLKIIELFAHKKIESVLNVLYTLNDCVFTIRPKFTIDSLCLK